MTILRLTKIQNWCDTHPIFERKSTYWYMVLLTVRICKQMKCWYKAWYICGSSNGSFCHCVLVFPSQTMYIFNNQWCSWNIYHAKIYCSNPKYIPMRIMPCSQWNRICMAQWRISSMIVSIWILVWMMWWACVEDARVGVEARLRLNFMAAIRIIISCMELVEEAPLDQMHGMPSCNMDEELIDSIIIF